MKVLIVCSGNRGKNILIKEQSENIEKLGVTIDYFLIRGKGITGYLKNLKKLNKKINQYNCDLIHAHYGLTGFLACLQRKVPVIITFHGSDIHYLRNRIISFLASRLADNIIFVNKKQPRQLLLNSHKYPVIPCGVNLNDFFPIPMIEARKQLKFDQEKKYVLFSYHFNSKIKNYPLAKLAIEKTKLNLELIEFSGYSRRESNLLYNAVNLLLITSKQETGPAVVKEAMACGCPIVSTNVGDVNEVIGDTEGCYITSFDPKDIAKKINMCITFNKKTNGRNNIINLGLSNVEVAKRIKSLYEELLIKIYEA